MFKIFKKSLHECFNHSNCLLLRLLLLPPSVTLLSIIVHRLGFFTAYGILSFTGSFPYIFAFFSAFFYYSPFTRAAAKNPLMILTPVPFYIPIFWRLLFSLPISLVIIASRIVLIYAFRGEANVHEYPAVYWFMTLSLFVFSYSIIILLISVKSIFRYKFNFDWFVNFIDKNIDKNTEDTEVGYSIEFFPLLTAIYIIFSIQANMHNEIPPIPWPVFFTMVISLSFILCFIASNILEKHSNY